MICILNPKHIIVGLFEATKISRRVGSKFDKFAKQIWFEKKNHYICEKWGL
jgi:hypothetical protein